MYTGIIFTFLAFLTSLIVTYKSIPAIITVARLKGLFDVPDGKRKRHRKPIPYLGGIALFGGLVISSGIWIGFYLPDYLPALLAALTILFFIGIKDDILILSPFKKIAGQVIAAVVLVFVGNVHIPGLDGLFGVSSFPFYTGEMFSVFAIIITINAYNLIDGVDGLAATISLIGSVVFGTWFLMGGHYAESIIVFSMAGTLLGFLYFNFEPAKIFMGDTGSYLTGLVMVFAAFRLVELNPVTPGFRLDAPALFVFSVMIIPMVDTLRVIIIRILNRESPMKADTRHMHYMLLRLGMRHWKVVAILALCNLAIIGISLLINSWNVYVYFAFLLILSTAIITAIMTKRVLKGRRETTSNTGP